MATITKNPNAPTPEPVDSPRRKCIDAGGKWNEEIQTCEMRKEAAPQQVEKGSQVIVTKPTRERVIQTPETLAEDKRQIEIQTARQEAISSGQLSASQSQERNIQEAKLEEERQALIANPAQRRELDPYRTELEKIPIIGGFIQEVLAIATRNEAVRKIPGIAELFPKDGGKLNYQPQPEELRNAVLTEIERREIEVGLSKSEKFGTFAESIQLGEIERYIPGLSEAELPSGNVQTIVNSLRQLKTRGRDIVSNAESGDLTRSQAEERIRIVEEELQAGESRIKLLIQNSPSLKLNSDGVNFIEGKIYETRIILDDARFAALEAPTKPTQMTDAKILNTLESFEDTEEDFTIPGL
jgi:hypothetical protein